MILVDTSILVYAVGVDHELVEPCRSLVDHVRTGRLEARTTVGVIQEFAHVRARRRGRKDAAQLARDFTELLAPLIVVTEATLFAALKLFERIGGLGSFDAVLAAAALEAGATGLASADAAFGDVGGLTWLQPGTKRFEEFVAS